MSQLLCQGHSSCAGCPEAIAIRNILDVAGKNTIISNATGCTEIVSSQYPTTSWAVPYIHVAFETAASVASGIESALKKLKKEVNVIALAGDGATFDIGFQALSGMLERGHKVCYICLDNGAYMNCLSLDSLIMTEEGLKRITEIKAGDNIYAFNQKDYSLVLKKCTGVFDNGLKDVFELNTLHHTIKATSNHPFLVLKRNGRGKKSYFVWKTLENLKKGDDVVILKNIKEGKSFNFKQIKISKKGDYKVNKINNVKIPKTSSPELMEFLGLYVGDGWVRTQKAEIGFALPAKTKERERFLELYRKIFKKSLIQKNNDYIYIYSVNLARFIDSLGFGKGAKNKIIPSWVFTLPKSEKEAFVKGLMLSDGYKIGNSNRYVSASYDLLRTLRLLLQTMGYQVGKIHQQKKKKGSFCVYRQLIEDSTWGYICFSKKRDADILKYPSQIKQRDFLADNDYFSTEKIISIQFVKKEPTLDLRVVGEHNFIADGIVVHNTGIQRSSATPYGAWTTTSPSGRKSIGNITKKKPIVEIIVAHRIPYAASASIGFMNDMKAKISKGLKKENQPSFINIDCPCPLGWRFSADKTIEIAKSGVETGIFPLYEIENGKVTINKEPSKPVKEYLKSQGRFKHLTEKDIKKIQSMVDEDWKRLKKRSNI